MVPNDTKSFWKRRQYFKGLDSSVFQSNQVPKVRSSQIGRLKDQLEMDTFNNKPQQFRRTAAEQQSSGKAIKGPFGNQSRKEKLPIREPQKVSTDKDKNSSNYGIEKRAFPRESPDEEDIPVFRMNYDKGRQDFLQNQLPQIYQALGQFRCEKPYSEKYSLHSKGKNIIKIKEQPPLTNEEKTLLLNQIFSINKSYISGNKANQENKKVYFRNQQFSNGSSQIAEEQIRKIPFKKPNRQIGTQQNNLTAHRKQVICFQCGGPHYLNQCTLNRNFSNSYSIKCFNCKKEGHTARNCQQQKKCSNCNSVEHFAKNCPLLDQKQIKKVCVNCLQEGHFAKQCQNVKRCLLCRQQGHQAKNCQKKYQQREDQKWRINKKELITCFNCHKTGHYANECKEPERCHNCNQQGHYSRDCPYMLRSLSMTDPNYVSKKKEQQRQNIWNEGGEKANSQSLIESGSKKLDFGRIPFKNYIRKQSQRKPVSNSKSKRCLRKAQQSKRKKLFSLNQRETTQPSTKDEQQNM